MGRGRGDAEDAWAVGVKGAVAGGVTVAWEGADLAGVGVRRRGLFERWVEDLEKIS